MAYCWFDEHNVRFKLKTGNYTNIIVFLSEHKLSFLSEMKLNFDNIPINLHGNGYSYNLLQYLSNNIDDYWIC